jgi:hypothetical protein
MGDNVNSRDRALKAATPVVLIKEIMPGIRH